MRRAAAGAPWKLLGVHLEMLAELLEGARLRRVRQGLLPEMVQALDVVLIMVLPRMGLLSTKL